MYLVYYVLFAQRGFPLRGNCNAEYNEEDNYPRSRFRGGEGGDGRGACLVLNHSLATALLTHVVKKRFGFTYNTWSLIKA